MTKKNEKVLYGELSDKNIPLKKEVPLSITVHKIGDNLIVDPTQEEEDISETRVTVGSHNGIISSMQKGNSKELSEEEMYKILDLIDKIWKKVYLKIEKFLK